MGLKVGDTQGSYLPDGSWQSGEETKRILTSGNNVSAAPTPYNSGSDMDGEFYRRTPTAGIPTHPDYGFGSQTDQGGDYFRGTNNRSNTATSTTATSTISGPTGPAPTFEAGTFKGPEYDESGYKSGQQKLAAPGLRRLREQVAVVQNKTYENPNVGAMTIRQALQGYGSAAETVLAGAYNRAVSNYEKKFQREYQTDLLNFRNQEAARQKNFQTALALWAKGKSSDGSTGSASRSSYTTTRAPGENVRI